ncbi:MAG TPA: hypothetical protein VM425_17990 [Myxococcota bacterium]|nr:hypothetical protein [Myxococcota bacterium]
MSWLIPVVGFLVLVSIIVFLALRKKSEPEPAGRLGLTDDGGVLRGQIQGFSLSVESQSSEKQRGPGRTIFRIAFPARLGLGIMIAQHQAGKRNLRALVTGDAEFDNSVCVETKEQKKVMAYLTPERRQCIRQLLVTYPGAWLNDEGITCNMNGVVRDFDTLRKTKDDLVDSAIELFPGRSARKAVRRTEKATSPH